MTTINAIYKDGIFQPTEPVELANDSHVRLQVEPVEAPSPDKENGMQAIYEIMARRFRSGQRDLAERHNEHQP